MKTASNYLKTGLSTTEVNKQLQRYGYNEITSKKEYTALRIFLSQFTSFLIIILIIAGSISIFLKETVNGIAIFAVVAINAIIGFIQEYKAVNAVNALKKIIVPIAVVLRNGHEEQIPVKELVPNDIVILSEGEKIPADLQIIEAFSLKVDESILTGESVPSNKYKSSGKEGKLFKGTLITTGRAKAKVIATGMNTEFGKIVNLMSKQEKTQSPLTQQLDNLGKKIGITILILISIIFILGILREIPIINVLMVSVALGVSAIPEGMPIIVTLTLAMGVQLLANRNAIVRKMSAIETLGATTIICSDKTGTLTLNEMTVKKINTNFNEKLIPGVGYTWEEKITPKSDEETKLLEICENCNNSFVTKNIIGDPTEIALKILAKKARLIKTYKKIDENVFTSERKMMSTLHKIDKINKEIMAKGAFEEIIKKCKYIQTNGKIEKITKEDKEKYKKIAESYAREALRVLAFAYKKFSKNFDEKDLIFIGLTGMSDPPRKTVKESIRIAKEAGIKIKIITGDNAMTARAIGEQIGLKINKITIGEEIDKLNDRELTKVI
ncbi:MAG: HAD-IC family P-type ATPase, partial [Candidatus Gracilibacteria bacterium]